MIARRREIAIRASLGAARGRIARLVFVEMAMLVALGAVGALALIQDANAADPTVFAIAAVGLGAAAFAASWLPARRAVRLDPMVALRSD
jgi:putative ABC transport system permease protein